MTSGVKWFVTIVAHVVVRVFGRQRGAQHLQLAGQVVRARLRLAQRAAHLRALAGPLATRLLYFLLLL